MTGAGPERPGVAWCAVAVLLLTHAACVAHDAGAGHPEQPARLAAVTSGLATHGLDAAVELVAAPLAAVEQIAARHAAGQVDQVERACATGRHLDPDTGCVPASWEAARRAVGAGLEAVRRIDAGESQRAFCAVRPPGHHATPVQSMGFCLFNNVAATASTLADRGERVLIVDVDAHHGNGTQAFFEDDPRVMFVSWHQSPWYPGTGLATDVGRGPAEGTVINFPLPARTTGDRYRQAIEEVLSPAVARFAPTWLLLSVGFDAHRDDPLAELGLTSGDYADILGDLVDLAHVPVVAFLEGGYDLEAVARSAAATVSALAGERLHPEAPTGGGPGEDAVARVAEIHRRLPQR